MAPLQVSTTSPVFPWAAACGVVAVCRRAGGRASEASEWQLPGLAGRRPAPAVDTCDSAGGGRLALKGPLPQPRARNGVECDVMTQLSRFVVLRLFGLPPLSAHAAGPGPRGELWAVAAR